MSDNNKCRDEKSGLTTLFKLWKLLLLLVLILAGISLHYTGVVDWQSVLAWAGSYTQYWWLPIVLISVQVILFTFALPGSAMLWVVAPLYAPLSATIILVTGATLGALCANGFARWESVGWSKQIQENHFFRVLEQRAGLLSLIAIRLLPGFPHSVINYGAGVLRLPLSHFLASSIIGLTVKAYLYCNAIHSAVSAGELQELLQFQTLWPLLLLAVISALAAVFLNRHSGN